MNNETSNIQSQFGIAIDIGTTTIKAYLVENQYYMEENRKIQVETKIKTEIEEKNSQYLYGKDVISRVMYAHYNGNAKLRESIIFQLQSLIRRLSSEINDNCIFSSIVITGNSVMLSILENFDLSGFERSPFESPSNFGYNTKIPELSPNETVYIPPIMDAFIGADALTAGFFALNKAKKTFPAQDIFPFLVVDIGTNGEILLFNEDNVFGASCAAGPAFEGKNLSKNISGSTAISYLAKMLKNKIMDKSGEILQNSQNQNSPLSQEDVRGLQLAKSAIKTGVEVLLSETNSKPSDIKHCFICGNFGNALQEEDILEIGLLPADFQGKIEYLGNGAGFGAVDLVFSEENREKIKKIATNSKSIELGGNPLFNKKYIENLNF